MDTANYMPIPQQQQQQQQQQPASPEHQRQQSQQGSQLRHTVSGGHDRHRPAAANTRLDDLSDVDCFDW